MLTASGWAGAELLDFLGIRARGRRDSLSSWDPDKMGYQIFGLHAYAYMSVRIRINEYIYIYTHM